MHTLTLYLAVKILSILQPGFADDRAHLARHSLITPFVDPSELKDWVTHDAAVAKDSQVSLIPSVPAKRGQLWNTLPILTDSFEIEFTFEVAGGPGAPGVASSGQARTPGFAFWVVAEHPPQLGSGPLPEEWAFFGHSRRFRGLGVFFSNLERGTKENPSITGAISDGSKEWTLERDIPTTGVYWNYRNSKVPMLFRLTVRPNEIIGMGRFETQKDWTHVFRLQGTVPKEGYMGFSADSGPSGPEGTPDATAADRVIIRNIIATNLDPHQLGESPAIPLEKVVPGASMERVLHAPAATQQQELIDSVKSLSDTTMRLLLEILPRHEELQHGVSALNHRLDQIHDDILHLHMQMGHGSDGGGHGEEGSALVAKVTNEISDLRDMMRTHAQAAHRVLQVGESIKAVAHGGPQQGARLEIIQDTLHKQARMSWIMFGLLITVVVSVSVVVWKKTRDLEKKHIF